MSDIATYIGVGAAIIGGFTGTVICVYFMDYFSRPFERRRQITLTAKREATAKVRIQVLDKLFPPNKKYEQGIATEGDEESGDGEETETCPICIQNLKQDEQIMRGPECHHIYHRSCMMEWLEKHSECPVCRKSMWTVDAFVKAKTKVLEENPAALEEEMQAVKAEEEAERQQRDGVIMVNDGGSNQTPSAANNSQTSTGRNPADIETQRPPSRPRPTRSGRPNNQQEEKQEE